MGIWGFWKRRKERERNLAEAASADAVKTAQDGVAGESAETNRTNEQEEEGFRFDREHHKPVIRSSICTGEQVAGFKDRRTGRFTEIMLVRDNEDIEAFTREYGISREEITREW